MIIYMYMILSDLFALLSDAFCVDVIDECTYCDATENRYNVGTIPGVLDHILYKGYRPLVTSCDFLFLFIFLHLSLDVRKFVFVVTWTNLCFSTVGSASFICYPLIGECNI